MLKIKKGPLINLRKFYNILVMKEGTVVEKTVMIIVDSKQEHPNQKPEVISFVTEGTYSKKTDVLHNLCRKSVTGLDGTTTTLEVASVR